MSLFNAPSLLVALTRARSVAINTLESAVAAAFALLPDETRLRLGTAQYAVDTGTVANTYLVAMPQTATAYVDGMLVSFQPNNSNTGAATINVDGLGVKSIRQYSGAVLNANDIVQGSPVDVRYSVSTGFFHRVGSGPAGSTGATGATGSIGTAPNGSLAAPSIAFTSEPGTGFWLKAAGKLCASVAGTQVAEIGTFSTAWGTGALQAVTIGTGNSAYGLSAVQNNTSGSDNCGFGASALSNNTIGSGNCAFGKGALQVTGVDWNTAMGFFALNGNLTGTQNVAVGYQAGYTATVANKNTTGSGNTWVGYNSGPGVVAATSLQNSSGFGNGALSMKNNQVVLGNASVVEWAPGSNGGVKLGSPTASFKGFYADYTIDGTVSNKTVNKMAGNAVIQAGLSGVTITNSLVTANSIVMVVSHNQANTITIPWSTQCVAGAFSIYSVTGATAAANWEFRWFVVSTD